MKSSAAVHEASGQAGDLTTLGNTSKYKDEVEGAADLALLLIDHLPGFPPVVDCRGRQEGREGGAGAEEDPGEHVQPVQTLSRGREEPALALHPALPARVWTVVALLVVQPPGSHAFCAAAAGPDILNFVFFVIS